MASLGRPKSLAWTLVSPDDAPTSPMNNVHSHDYGDDTVIEEFKAGDARVKTHFEGEKDFSMEIETSDLGKHSQFRVGQKVTNLILTVEAAIESNGAKVGTDYTVTLSKAVVSEKGRVAHGNENSAPAVASITFKLDRAAADSADPTVVIAAVGGG